MRKKINSIKIHLAHIIPRFKQVPSHKGTHIHDMKFNTYNIVIHTIHYQKDLCTQKAPKDYMNAHLSKQD
jgi:hypothetical protein